MIRRIAIAALVLAALAVAYPFAKDAAVEWYVDNHYVRETAFPSTPEPDLIALTFSGDPKSTLAINWRTNPATTTGRVRYKIANTEEMESVAGTHDTIEDRLLENDPTVHRHTAVIDNLTPATVYEYSVAIDEDTWTDWTPVQTAPEDDTPFSFVYLGDPQRGFEEWGELVNASYERHPGTAFYVIAGDLVNDGNWRNEWDEFFHYTESTFGRVPIVPCLGNHDVEDDNSADMYFASMALPDNGPDIGPERAFHFTWSNALFVVLDSNLDPETQSAWLDKVLSESDATWKFAVYHHPAYSSRRARDNRALREQWGAIFDNHHLDMALQGHDHAYLRTYPMREGRRVDTPAEGTYYIVTVSGTKFYDQEEHDYAEVAFPETMTYQTIDIDGNKLTYKALNVDGETLDEITIQK